MSKNSSANAYLLSKRTDFLGRSRVKSVEPTPLLHVPSLNSRIETIQSQDDWKARASIVSKERELSMRSDKYKEKVRNKLRKAIGTFNARNALAFNTYIREQRNKLPDARKNFEAALIENQKYIEEARNRILDVLTSPSQTGARKQPSNT